MYIFIKDYDVSLIKSSIRSLLSQLLVLVSSIKEVNSKCQIKKEYYRD